ncbi:hypothetical protein C0J52_19783 [Blattella germanica]|nr:hypothetical protein C0J52_19783 [Blattella germanica]
MCKLCNKRLCWEKGDVLEKHIKSNQHVRKLANQMAENETNIIFKAITELFIPGVAGQFIDVNPQKVIATKSRIPYFNKVNDDNFLCAYEYFHKNLRDAVGDNSNVDCLQMLLAMKLLMQLLSKSGHPQIV